MLAIGASTAAARADVFIEGLVTPRGIATDLQGNVYVHSDVPPVTTRVSKRSR